MDKEQIMLGKCTKYINYDKYLGYFPFDVANYLVGTGKYKYQQVTCWGYVLKKIE